MEQAGKFHADVFVMNLFDIGKRYLGMMPCDAEIPESILKKRKRP